MADEIFDFRWFVSKGGYQIMRGHPGGILNWQPNAESESFVTDGIPIGQSAYDRAYHPLVTHPDLFLQFAASVRTEDGVLTFANRYGLLKGDEVFATQELNLGIHGDPLADWMNEIRRMSETVALWELHQVGSPELAKIIRWRKDRVSYHWAFGGGTLASAEERPHWFKRWKHGETQRPTVMLIQIEINDHLNKHVAAQIRWNAAGTALDAYFVPKNLLGAMWLQFARALLWPKKFRPCQVCRKLIEISTDPHSQVRKRTDALLCGDRCRSQKRRDKKKTLQMRLSVKSLPRIQKQLHGNYSLATLKQWVSEGSQQHD
jgi:hypothetical protein